jgi:hypothetical protein
MLRKKFAIAIVAGTMIGGMGLAGGAEASRCGGMPDGVVDLDTGPASGTWDSPGEVVSYVVALYGSEGLRGGGPPGQLVKVLCGGAPVAP